VITISSNAAASLLRIPGINHSGPNFVPAISGLKVAITVLRSVNNAN
jgi:hypothetical protein